MNIHNNINPITYKSNISTNTKNNSQEYTTQHQQNFKPVYAKQLSSKSIHFGSKNINQLYDEYNWYINHDKTPAIEAFLKIDDDKETMDGFFTTILNTDDRSYQMIDSIVKQQKNTPEILAKLKNKIGPNSKNFLTFLPNSPYNKAYSNYLEKRVENTNTLSELLRVRPDIKGDVLIQKYHQLKGYAPLEIGGVPKEFPNEHLFQISDYLKTNMEEGMKTQKNINSMTLDNRKYDFKFFTEGKSDKNVFGVFTPEGKKFVIKMADERYRSLDEAFALGTLAKIDTFLTTNRSHNSAPLCYYNHDKNMSVYKYIEHSPIQGNAKNLNEIQEHIPDFRALGLTYNDNVGNKNLFLLDEQNVDKFDDDAKNEIPNAEWISVDNDHVTFNSILQPNVRDYNSQLPNAMQMFF